MKLEAVNICEADIPDVVVLFARIIDELHRTSTEEVRQQFKATYSEEQLKLRLQDDRGVYLVLKIDGEVAGFAFGWSAGGVGALHWLGIAPELRGKGYSKVLVEKVMSEFERLGCYQVELYTYPEFPAARALFKKFGFAEAAFIEKNFFGINVIYMNKDIKEVHDEMRTKKIVLAGEAGQGIRLMAQILAEILTRLQKYVTLNLVYGPSVRSGEVQAELLYCDKPISVPLVEDVDVLLLLSDADVSRYQAKEVIIEKSLCDTEKVACELKYPSSERVSFSKIATEEFGSSRFVNMVALGTLLRHIGVNIEKVNFQAKLPSRYIKENLEAIKYGYLHLDLSGTGTEK